MITNVFFIAQAQITLELLLLSLIDFIYQMDLSAENNYKTWT